MAAPKVRLLRALPGRVPPHDGDAEPLSCGGKGASMYNMISVI